ncbi:hypothetical protein [uncultured Gammaproteobacteria bacterium]|nr:hypothetical protein [uncultured Gammaproteobacteria bacterium]
MQKYTQLTYEQRYHIYLLNSRPLKTKPNQTKTTHFSNHLNQQNCFLSSTTKNLRYFNLPAK